jgi:hypothetical protein
MALKSFSAILAFKKLFAKTMVTSKSTTMALVSMTVEIAGLTALLFLLNSLYSGILNLKPTPFYPNFINMGTSFAAKTAIITRTAACLKPAATDSSLILPATIPIK